MQPQFRTPVQRVVYFILPPLWCICPILPPLKSYICNSLKRNIFIVWWLGTAVYVDLTTILLYNTITGEWFKLFHAFYRLVIAVQTKNIITIIVYKTIIRLLLFPFYIKFSYKNNRPILQQYKAVFIYH